MTASPTRPIPAAILLGRLNKIYGDAEPEGPDAAPVYHGKYGFILD